MLHIISVNVLLKLANVTWLLEIWGTVYKLYQANVD